MRANITDPRTHRPRVVAAHPGSNGTTLPSSTAVLALLWLAATSGAAFATDESAGDLPLGQTNGSVEQPRRHLRLRRPAAPKAAEVVRIYNVACPSLVRGYTGPDHAESERCQSWSRFNSLPYLRATHGNHYVNNYANEIARD